MLIFPTYTLCDVPTGASCTPPPCAKLNETGVTWTPANSGCVDPKVVAVLAANPRVLGEASPLVKVLAAVAAKVGVVEVISLLLVLMAVVVVLGARGLMKVVVVVMVVVLGLMTEPLVVVVALSWEVVVVVLGATPYPPLTITRAPMVALVYEAAPLCVPGGARNVLRTWSAPAARAREAREEEAAAATVAGAKAGVGVGLTGVRAAGDAAVLAATAAAAPALSAPVSAAVAVAAAPAWSVGSATESAPALRPP